MATPTVADPGTARGPRIFYGYWIVLAAFTALMVAAGTQTTVAGAFLKPMADELDWTRTEYTYVQTLGRFVMAGVGFWLGTRVDQYGGRRFMFIGTVIIGASLFATAEVQNLWQWIVVRGIVFTVGAAMIGNLVVTVTVAKWWVRKRGAMIGIAGMGFSVAGIVFPMMATVAIDEFGWRAAWRITAVVAIALILPASAVMRRQPEDYGLHPDGLSDEQNAGEAGRQAADDYANSFTRAEALRTSALYLIIAAFAISSVGLGTMLFQTLPFLTDQGYSGPAAAGFSAMMSSSSLVSKPFWGWTTGFIEPKYTSAAGFILAGGGLGIVVAAANANADLVLGAGFLVLGLGFGSQVPLEETIWGTYFGRRYLGSIRGVAMPLSIAIGAGGPLVVSWYFDLVGNYNGVLLGISGLWFLAAVVIMFVRRPVKPAPKPEAILA